MGIPWMLTYLRDRNVITKSEFRHEVRAGEETKDDRCSGPSLVFDNRALAEILLIEWEKLPSSHILQFDPTRGGRITQFRTFSKYYLKHLVEVYQCTIVWVRDAGVNDKPAIIPDRVYDFVEKACKQTDQAIKSPGRRNAVDIVSGLYWREEKDEEFLLETIADAGLGSSVLVVDAPANRTDAEVWRQAKSMSTARRTFIFSPDTDMFFFPSTTRSIGIVLLLPPDRSHRLYGSQAVGSQWSCDIGRDLSSTRCLRLKFCCVEDVANVFDIEPQCLPILGACLGGDLGIYDNSVRKFTIHLQAALLDKHFRTPAVTAAFRRPAEDLRKDRQAVAKARMQRLLGNVTCYYGEFCSRASCERVHPAEGNLRCKNETLPAGRCANPSCRFRHTRPISFRIAPKFVDRFEGHESLKSAVFDTWGQAVTAVDGLIDEWKKTSYGIGPSMASGFELSFNDILRSTIFRRTSELVRTRGKSWRGDDGEVDMDACARDLCVWLDNTSSVGGGDHGMVQAILTALRCYQPLPMGQHPARVELQAPSRKLETWRLRKFYWVTPYPLPSDAANLNHITKYLRARISHELGVAGFVEGMQIGSEYVVIKNASGRGIETHCQESSLVHGNRRRPTEILTEALGFNRCSDERWLQDLDTMLQTLPGLFPETVTGPDAECNARVTVSPAVGNNNIEASKTIVLSIVLWQRTLDSSKARVPNIVDKYAYENVATLSRWEVRAFIGSTILGWIQLKMKACPFNLLAVKQETDKESDDGLLFSSIPASLRRRAFLLVAQFLELTNDVGLLTSMMSPGQDHLIHGMREICLNPEMIFSVYSAVGPAKSEHVRDQRVRSKLIAVASSDEGINSERVADVCDRLVDHVMGTRSNDFEDLAVEDWEDLAGLSF